MPPRHLAVMRATGILVVQCFGLICPSAPPALCPSSPQPTTRRIQRHADPNKWPSAPAQLALSQVRISASARPPFRCTKTPHPRAAKTILAYNHPDPVHSPRRAYQVTSVRRNWSLCSIRHIQPVTRPTVLRRKCTCRKLVTGAVFLIPRNGDTTRSDLITGLVDR